MPEITGRLTDKFGVKEVMDVTFYDLEDMNPVLYVDTLKLSNLENTAEESMARGGRGNPILLSWDYNREANFTIQDALVSPDGLALMTGMDLEDLNPDDAIVYEREVITLPKTGSEGTTWAVEENIELKYTPLSADRLFIYDQYHGIAGGAITPNNIVGTTITLNPNNIITNDDVEKVIVAYYPYTRTTTHGPLQTVEINSDDFPGYYRIVGDTMMRNARTGRDEPFQLVVHRAKILPGFTLTMEAEGDPSVFDMNLKVMRPLDSPNMITMTKYSDTTS